MDRLTCEAVFNQADGQVGLENRSAAQVAKFRAVCR